MYRKLLVMVLVFSWIGPILADSATVPFQPILRLNDFITLEETTENNETLALQFGIPTQDIDINSIIKINVRTEDFFESIPTDLDMQSITTEQRELLRLSGKLREAFQIIDDALGMVTQLQNYVNLKQRDSEEFEKLSKKLQEAYSRSFEKILVPYRDLLEQSPRAEYMKHGKEYRDNLNNAITDPNSNPLLFLIKNEIAWITLQLELAGVSIRQKAIPMALNLIAYTYDDGKQKFHHLPNYDDIPAGAPVNINKLNTVPSPEELAKLKKLYEEAQSMAKELNQIEDKREALKAFLNIALTNTGIDVKALQIAANTLKQELEKTRTYDWAAELQRANARIEQVLQDELLTEERRTSFQKINELVIKLYVSIDHLSLSLSALENVLKTLVPRLDEAAVQSQHDPLAALLIITENVSASFNAYKSIKHEFEALLQTGQRFGSDIAAVGKEVKALLDSIDPAQLGDTLAAEVNGIFKQLKLEHIDRILVAYAKTEQALKKSILDPIKQLSSDTQDALNTYVATIIYPPEMSYFVPLYKAKNTWLDIRTIVDREEGHLVTLHARLYRIEQSNGQLVINKESVLDAETQQFRLLRYGLFGAYSVGLAYIESRNILEGQTEKTQSFQPNVSWIMRLRNWRDYDDPARYVHRWYKSIGIGVHTVTLDLNNDNQMEVGMGVTLSILDELFQFGYGRDLSLNEDYYFIATRLLEFGKKR